MTIRSRWAVAITATFCAAILAYSLAAHGAAGGKPANRGGGGGHGGGPSVGAMRPSAPAMNAARPAGGRPANFNSMAGARPANNSSSPRAGLTGMQSAPMRQNNLASRPDLGLGGGRQAGTAQNFAQARQPSSAISTRPPFNAQPNRDPTSNLAASNRRDSGDFARPGGAGQSAAHHTGLAPTITPAGLTRPTSNNLAGDQPGSRQMFPGGRPSITGSNKAGGLAGLNRPGSNIPGGRPDLGGGGSSPRPDVVFKPDISNPNRSDAGILPQPNRPGSNRPGQGGGGEQLRPGSGGDNRPSRPGQGGGGEQFPGRGGDDRPSRPGQGGSGEQWRPGWPNRPGGNNNINTGNINSGNNIWNRTNNNWNVNNNWTSNRQNIVNNSPTIVNTGYRPGFAVPGYGYGYQGNWGYGQQSVYDNSWQCGPGWMPAYGALHDNWCHGSWNGYSGNSNWQSFGAGAATGWLTSWAFGSRPNSWGYSSYSNPYDTSAAQTNYSSVQTVVAPYNYSQPINTEAPPPAQETIAPATATLDQARQAFMDSQYDQALTLANQVVASLPNDPTVHQFRALALFALARYDEASQTLYPVLSVGPGWDWTTVSGLYPSEEPYKQQLTALENYVQSHPDMASPRFLLAYHYLTIGSSDAAADQLRQVVKLKPTDGLSRQMLALLDSAKQSATVAEEGPVQPATQTAPTAPNLPPQSTTIPPAALVGTWSAKPDDKTAIKLTLAPDGKFIWDVNGQNGQNQLRGNYTMGDGNLLTLAQDQQGGTLAGNIAKAQNGGFSFRLMGAPPSDKGLSFVRQL